MVRVISVHHFTKQEVAKCPVFSASVLTSDNFLVLSTHDQYLEVRNLKDGAKVSHSFQTVDRVSHVYHCRTGDYLVTLEGDFPMTNVRVYTNWRDPGTNSSPVRPRIAGCVTPSTNCDERFVDMIEIPQRDSPLQVNVCSSTGNLIVAAKDLVIIYKLVIQVNESKKQRYLDFNEILHVFHRFIPTEICLSEDVIACLSQNEVHIFKVKFMTDNQEGGSNSDERYFRSISIYSFSSEPDQSLDLNHRCTNGSESDSTSSIVCTPSSTSNSKVNITAKRQVDSETSDFEMEGYIGNVKRHKNFVADISSGPTNTILPEIEMANRSYHSMVNSPKIMFQTLGPSAPPNERPTTIKYVGNDVSCHLEAECVTLVHSKLLDSEEDHETFKNLKLEPVFWREFRVRRNQKSNKLTSAITSPFGNAPTSVMPNHPLHSNYHSHLMSLTACFTSKNEGYVYHLPGHLRKVGKGCGVQKIATYPFTSPVGQVALEPSFLHSVTDTGLETYTLRSGYYTVKEAESLNNKTNCCPETEENPICLVGLRPFIGAQYLMVSRDYLALITTSGQGEGKEFTLYALKLPSPVDVYKDMIQLADLNKLISPQGYYQLLCESHFMLRTTKRSLSWDSIMNVAVEEADTRLVEESFRKTCWLLAIFCLKAADPKTKKLVLPLFRMSGEPMHSMLNYWKVDLEQDLKCLPGLIHLIKHIILTPMSDQEHLDANVTDLIIDILGTHDAAELSSLVLKSKMFKEFKSSKIMTHVSKSDSNITWSSEQLLAFLLLGLDQGLDLQVLGEKAKEANLNPVGFSNLLIQYPHFLLETSSDGNLCFTDLASLMENYLPGLLSEVLVSLVLRKEYSISSIMQPLLGSMTSLSSNDLTTSTANLQLVLETYFTEVIEDQSHLLDENDESALQTLVRSYLTSLSVPIRFADRDIDIEIFGNRFSFLDKMSPFVNSAAKEVLDADSPEFWCQNSLLKLQSLLCAPKLSLQSCKTAVKGYLEVYTKERAIAGSLSLTVLALEKQEAITLLCKEQPGILLLYAKDVEFQKEDWQCVLTCLQGYLASDHDESRHEVWYSAMQEVLDHLAQTMAVETFLQILPGPENSEEFQGYIQMCRKNQEAEDIRNLIMTTGHKLLSTLNI